ncbi:peptidase M24 [Desulfatibacillum aliphaticivorans]|uniref:Peptidase M24 n=2 Tax=Desulfatibacillum aliphaticivorans TaxID=218208 RepID=B8FHC6_DESAL|nr:peptidase M24 [Desulfatibacillum aliphaticivorans]
MEKRIETLRKLLAGQPFDTFMVMVEENRRYLSGFTGEDSQFDESSGCLFVNQDKVLLATDSRYTTQAENECPHCQVYTYEKGLAKAMPEILGMFETKKLGFEQVRLSYLIYQKIVESLDDAQFQATMVPSSDFVEQIRVIKDQSEIDAMQKALAISEQALVGLMPKIEPGMTEKALAWELEKAMRSAGGDSLAFPSIVASGPNSALPHHGVSDREVREGEFLLFDWGCKKDGYCSDISRTTVLGAPKDDEMKKIFQTVLEAQTMATQAVRPGINSRDVDNIARKHIEEAGYGGKFGHGLGHGVGLAVHEAPRVSPLASVELQPGMVFTVEPGIYIPHWGGVRLENMAAVTEDGVQVLNSIGQFWTP